MRVCAQAPPHFSGMSFFLKIINCLIHVYIDAKHVIVNDIYTIFRCQNISPVLEIFHNCACLFIKGRGCIICSGRNSRWDFFSLLQKPVLPRVVTSCADLEEWQGRGAKT